MFNNIYNGVRDIENTQIGLHSVVAIIIINTKGQVWYIALFLIPYSK